ncbi:hypothetical protein SUGI_1086240 [Cryptomeria japonica]|uniref:jacalin-related lectin 19 n=1 Tax=Cryptomeria japonica TaxID=3369 RepID=UPI002414B326|nr:jacalin-related lectin 19 [Cryptomeria japonica]GLJ51010.1 hypothetical protein SUGI_1086240 [Cryptomeria japonica]
MPIHVIKVKYEDIMVRFKVVLNYHGDPDISLQKLKSKIFDRFKLKGVADELNLRYTDEDGDVIVILDEEGYLDVFRQNLSPIYIEASFSRSEGSFCLKCSEISFHNLGPFGGGGGIDWNDGNFEGINGITVTSSSECLISIQVSYATGKDTTHTGARHGGAGEAVCMKFKYPDEKLQKISGYCGLVENTWTVIKGLSFETNLAKYGLFGVADWIPLEFDLRSRDVVGVYGRACNRYLGSIGLHTSSMLPKLNLENEAKSAVNVVCKGRS